MPIFFGWRKYLSLILGVLLLIWCCNAVVDFSFVRERGNYTCDELTRWLGTEKHYSNDKKEIIFQLIGDKKCENVPALILSNIAYGWQKGSKRTFYEWSSTSGKSCDIDQYGVAYLSNFSINNNFSHFLHGILRLFCALIDAGWIVWSPESNSFQRPHEFTLWIDEFFKVNDMKLTWLKSISPNIKVLRSVGKGECVLARNFLYGSGCVKLLPPEKWFGYPGCRAGSILPAFGHYMRTSFSAPTLEDLIVVDEESDLLHGGRKVRVAFDVRDTGPTTGRRAISNLLEVQRLLISNQHVRTSTENISFEHLDVSSTVRYMAGVHIFVSVHGAGMTNMFFMNPGTAVVEIIPYPLCHCQSPDFFYGVGGYYHGSSVAQGIRHYPYCVPAEDVSWHEVPNGLRADIRCSWKHLHAVESVRLDPRLFLSVMRKVERDLVVSGTIKLTKPIINMSPHANGRL